MINCPVLPARFNPLSGLDRLVFARRKERHYSLPMIHKKVVNSSRCCNDLLRPRHIPSAVIAEWVDTASEST